jgi:hypothetical protein
MTMLKGSLFTDYGGGWNDSLEKEAFFKGARTSVGFSLTSYLSLMGVIPVEAGIEAGYKLKEEKVFTNLIFTAQF